MRVLFMKGYAIKLLLCFVIISGLYIIINPNTSLAKKVKKKAKIITSCAMFYDLPNPIKLIGANGSPYTRKMLSFLRYKRIPYTMIWSDVDTYFSKAKIEIEKPKPVLFPTFLLPVR